MGNFKKSENKIVVARGYGMGRTEEMLCKGTNLQQVVNEL